MNAPLRAAAVALGLVLALSGCQRETEKTGSPAVREAASEGERLYEYHCATCHGPGPGHPGTEALRVKYQGELPELLTERKDLTPELIRYFVRGGVGAMPYFRKTEISDKDLEVLARYMTSGNEPKRD